VAKSKDGSLSGKWGSPDQGAKNLTLESLEYKDGVLAFSAKTAGATYKGKMNESGTEVVGEWSLQPGRREVAADDHQNGTVGADAAQVVVSDADGGNGDETLRNRD
jgi:hypothetical protein